MVSRRNFMALMGGLALAAAQPELGPRIQLPAPLPELTLSGFSEGDEFVWINGQPLRGVMEIDIHDEAFPLFGGVSEHVYYRPEGPFRSAVLLRGARTEQTYRDFYHLVEHHYYEMLDIILLQIPSTAGRARLYHQQMAIDTIGSVHERWERPRPVFGYPDYSRYAPRPRLPEDIEGRAWGIYLELISKEPYDEWRWWADNPAGSHRPHA